MKRTLLVIIVLASMLLAATRGQIDFDQVKTAARKGTGVQFQMFGGGSTTTGNAAVYDVNGNIIDGGAAPGGATTNQNIRTVSATFDGGGSALSGTTKRCSLINYGGTIKRFTMVSDLSGNATIDVLTVAYGSYTGPASAS